MAINSNIHVYGLLHIESAEDSSANMGCVDAFSDRIDIYLKGALALARTLAMQNISYTLLTNRPDLIRSKDAQLNVVNIPFQIQIPSGTKFYSAHYKIDVFKYFSGLRGQYSLLCDLDVICINKIPSAFKYLIKSRTPVCYDISDQVIPAYGHEVIIRDLECVLDASSEGRWYGGEFIGGDDKFFTKLHTTIMKFFPAYIENIEGFHHVGDEAIVSPSIEYLRKQFYIADAGTIGIVSRYWNAKVLHPQKPFAWSKNCFLVHLPADKSLLAKASGWSDPRLANFIIEYESILKSSNLVLVRFAKKAKILIKKYLIDICKPRS